MLRYRLLAPIVVLAALATVLVWKHRAEEKPRALAGGMESAEPASRQAQHTSLASAQTLPPGSIQYPAKLPVNGQSANQAGANLANNPANKSRSRQPLSDSELAALLERRLTPAMRATINEQLQPGGSPPRERQGPYGSFLDFSDRAASVMIAVIDDDGNTVITDVMQALPEPGE